MPKRKELSTQKRAMIIGLHQSGKSNRQIAKDLRIPRRTVDYNVKKFQVSNSFANKKRSGRPRNTTSTDDRYLVITSKRNRRLTAPEITAHVNLNRDVPISVSTVKRRLQAAGLHGRIAVRKPLLRAVNKKKRLQWAKIHKDWTTKEWEKVLWSDESKFEIFGSKRRIFVRRSAGEKILDQCVVPSVKFGGGSVMVWGCFGGGSVGDLVKIDGILKKEGYKRILQKNAIPSGKKLIGKEFIFMHDNDPKHSSKLCKAYLETQERKNVLKVMQWPPQSPDLNPIELIWDELDRKVRKSCPTSITHLWSLLQTEWKKIGKECLEKLIKRMPRICAALIRNKGNHIDESKI